MRFAFVQALFFGFLGYEISRVENTWVTIIVALVLAYEWLCFVIFRWGVIELSKQLKSYKNR